MSDPIKEAVEWMTQRRTEAKGMDAGLEDYATKLYRADRLASESKTTAEHRMAIVTGLRAVQVSLELYADHLSEDLDRLGVKA